MNESIVPLYGTALVGRAKPHAMTTVPCDPQTRELVERIAIEIFTDMTNAGRAFQQALAAIYLSGLSAGSKLESERLSPPPSTR